MLEAVRNVRLVGREGLWRIRFDDGKIASVEPDAAAPAGAAPATELDGEGGLALPPFVEPHIHLDTILTAGEPAWNLSGTLFEGIRRWAERKKTLTAADVKTRARKALSWQIAHGVQFVRSHVDVTDPELTALRALLELREEMRPWVTVQLVAFPQEGICSFPGGAELLEEALRLGADAVGAIPHYELTREHGIRSLEIAFDLAQRYERLVDVHCDEIDDEQSRFLEVVAALAFERGMGRRVAASHTTAMGSYNDAYTARLFGLLERSEISFVANPLVNIHLQGRFDSYPKRRGLTRVKELLAAGINVCFGHDDIFDPWYPLGTGNVMDALFLGLHVCQLMGREEISDSHRLITTNSAATLALGEDYGLAVGRPAGLIVMTADDWYEAVRLRAPVRYSVREARLLAETAPAVATVHLPGEERIDFRR